MVLFDRPDWIQHGGTAILGVDIDPPGERLATCGADNRIRIWAMRPLRLESVELDPAVPKLLATLTEALAPVNCVRFAPAGHILAAGTDESDALVYELRQGRSSAAFGSSEAPSIENWRLRCRLRGHAANVTDVSWAPDSRRLATASVDNKVKIWDAASGHCIRTLEGHVGFVKGVAWDPFDRFLASQGDREMLVWRLEDGSNVARITKPFAGAPIVSFALRPAWSPDGQTLAAANGYDNGAHTAPIIPRNAWDDSGWEPTALCGHRGTVTAVRYNPHLYVPPKRRLGRPDAEAGAAAAAAENGAEGAEEDGDVGGIVALGSMDKQFTAWHPRLPEPLLLSRGSFGKMINDLAWSPDGRLLVAASQDGSVMVTVFEGEELGRQVSEEEVAALQAQLYGDPRVRNQKNLNTLNPEMLELEARTRADVEKEQREQRLNSRMGAASAAAAVTAGAAAAATGLRPTGGAGALRAASPAKSGGLTATHLRAHPEQPPAKRTAVHPSHGGAAGPVPAPAGPAAGGARPFSAAPAPAASSGGGITATAGSNVLGLGQAVGAVAAAAQYGLPGGQPPVPHEPIQPLLGVTINVRNGVTGEQQAAMELQASNTGRDFRGRPAAELVCLVAGRRQWTDSVPGQVVSLAGSSRIAAVSTTLGRIMVYSSAGRRLLPPQSLGCPAAFLAVAPGSTLLLAVLTDGRVMLWDVAAGEQLLETSVAFPLAEAAAAAGGSQQQPIRVSGARLTSSGSPLVVLSNAHAYVYQRGMRCWACVADDSYPASAYTTSLAPASVGELGRLQAAVAQRRHPRDVLTATARSGAGGGGGGGAGAAGREEVAVLESNLAAAVALQSPSEFRMWLVMYVRRLAMDEDEIRLRDLIAELMGPERWSPVTHPSVAPASSTTTSGAAWGRGSMGSGTGAGGFQEPPPLAGCSVVGRWQPAILGLDKRRLLREVLLKEVNRNRAYQPLVTQVLDQLRCLEGAPQQPAPQQQQQQLQQQQARAAFGAGMANGVGGAAAGAEEGGLLQRRHPVAPAGLQPPQHQQQPMALG